MQSSLPTAILGRTDLEVTRLGFGCALWREDKPQWTSEQAIKVWTRALDVGINFFDTAYDYVFSEEWIGWSLQPRYGEFYLATKSGCTDSRPTFNNSDHMWTRDNLLRNIEISLRRLNRDNVDILQLHNATTQEIKEGGLVEALMEIKEQGLVKWIGSSTTLPDLPEILSWNAFDVMQIPYSALERQHEDWITKAARQGVGIIIRGGVAQGEHNARQESMDRWDVFSKAGLDELLDEGESRSSFVLRYTLSHPDSHTVIVGTTSVEHLNENINTVLKGPLSQSVYSEAKHRMDGVGHSPELVN